jgi:hypothetical protein
LWKAFQKIGNKLASGEYKVYSPTQFQINPIQDINLKGTTKAFIKQNKGSSNPFGGLVEYIIYFNPLITSQFTAGEGDYLWDPVNDRTYVISSVILYDDIIGIELPNRISISRTEYVSTLNGTEAQKNSLVDSLPCVVEFGAFNMGGVVPASSPAQGGYDQVKITTGIDPSIIRLGDIITHNDIDMSILSIAYTPLTKGATIIAKVMG